MFGISIKGFIQAIDLLRDEPFSEIFSIVVFLCKVAMCVQKQHFDRYFECFVIVQVKFSFNVCDCWTV